MYDHSSALLIREEDEPSLRVVAEQIAWTKAKSARIGLPLPITDAAAALLQSERSTASIATVTAGASGQDQPAQPRLATLLDYNATTRARARTYARRRCSARRWSRATAWSGVLKIAARYPVS